MKFIPRSTMAMLISQKMRNDSHIVIGCDAKSPKPIESGVALVQLSPRIEPMST
jgi:hypothetical protein